MRIICCVASTCGGERTARAVQGRAAHLAQGARDEALDDGAAVVVQQMHLVDDQQLHQLRATLTARPPTCTQWGMARTCASATSPVLLRVTTSHFSGVVTSMLVAAISALVSCMSPVSSRTLSPSGF